MLTVVLPQPPFWLKTVMIFAGTSVSLSALKAPDDDVQLAEL
ncbi:hypothetical protein [Cupriavidus sp. 2SB]|nr:hypothetical protein [Cupriavidus sp. 2SB]